jgi:hypothetical protein
MTPYRTGFTAGAERDRLRRSHCEPGHGEKRRTPVTRRVEIEVERSRVDGPPVNGRPVRGEAQDLHQETLRDDVRRPDEAIGFPVVVAFGVVVEDACDRDVVDRHAVEGESGVGHIFEAKLDLFAGIRREIHLLLDPRRDPAAAGDACVAVADVVPVRIVRGRR